MRKCSTYRLIAISPVALMLLGIFACAFAIPETATDETGELAESTLLVAFCDSDSLLRTTRELFNLEYIHNEMGITGDGVRVGLVTIGGVDATHPCLAHFANPETGWMRGFNITLNSPDTSATEYYNHGNQTAGPIAAIAPGAELWVYVAQSTSDIIAAIEMALQDEIDVLNLSLGTGGPIGLDPLTYAKNQAVLNGMIIVQSAGNNGTRGRFSIEGRGDAGLTILVGNAETGRDDGLPRDRLFGTSSRGPSPQSFLIRPDIVAPGTGARTTNNPNFPLRGPSPEYFRIRPDITRNPDVNEHETNDSEHFAEQLFSYPIGNSFSAPVVAALAALLVEAFPEATPQEIKAKIMNTARPLAEDTSSIFDVGAGHIDPIRALRARTIVTTLHAIPWSYTERERYSIQTMASLSFGRADRLVEEHNNAYMLPLLIKNIGNEPRVYTIAYRFERNPNGYAVLSFNETVLTVLPGEIGTVDVTMSLAGFSADPSFEAHTYEGHIFVYDGDDVVATIPFAGDIFRAKYPQTIEITGPARFSHGGRMQEFSVKTTNIPPGRAFELVVHSDSEKIKLEPAVTTERGTIRLGVWTHEHDVRGEYLVSVRVGNVESEPFGLMVGPIGPVRNHAELATAIASIPTDGTTLTIEVGADFQMERRLTINPGRNVIIKSVYGEPTRNITAPETGRHFMSAGTMTLKNIVLDGGTGDSYRGGIDKTWGGCLTIEEGGIIQGAFARNGAGVIVRSPAAVTMNGGEIRYNTASNVGGAIYLMGARATFSAIGGTIANNHAAGDGGGIWTLLNEHANPVSEESYLNIYIGEDFKFYGNSSDNGAYMPPSNNLPHIRTNSASIAHSPLNNYDINYRGSYSYSP